MRIVTLSTFPFEMPRHGGQHRLANIVAQYRAFGHVVKSAGVLGGSHYPATEGFLVFPPMEVLQRHIDNAFLMEDWAIGEWVVGDDRAFDALAALVPKDTDVLHVELPWLFRFAQRLASMPARKRVRLVYGSENIEHLLKQNIVKGYMGETHARECAKRVLACERNAIAGADLICAVSEHDVNWISQYTKKKVALASNGVARRSPQTKDFAAANRATMHQQFALYCASAHPPNVVGFADVFGRGLGCLAPNQKLVVAGSAGAAIQGANWFGRTPGLSRHFVATGEVSDETLSALVELAHVMLLPMSHGGGTNLKTAEALWAGHHIVATPTAMRGFESFSSASGLSVAAEPAAFLSAIRAAMALPPVRITAAERESRKVLLWQSTLKPLMEQVNGLDR